MKLNLAETVGGSSIFYSLNFGLIHYRTIEYSEGTAFCPTKIVNSTVSVGATSMGP